jgi:lipopolysaccharide/colanic/teichoic acid biosynthesis glycosyltransferase
MDIIIAITSLIISLPILAIVAIIIPIDSSGPVLIRQERVGKNGKSFRLLKFRSMFLGADKDIHKELGVKPIKISSLKKQDDPRVTHAGRVIRRWSIDEFPQFWNVLCGDMSIVGPRPEERWIVELYNKEQLQRLTVKPGLTGPMQISGRGELDMDARLVLEMDYINNFSIWNDIKILIKTIPVVISGKGAY